MSAEADIIVLQRRDLEQLLDEHRRLLLTDIDDRIARAHRPYLTRTEASERAKCSLRKIDYLIAGGHITVSRNGRRVLIEAKSLDDFLAGNT